MLVDLEHPNFKSVGKGLYINPFPFNFDHALTNKGFRIKSWREEIAYFTEANLYHYGVIDSPEQFAEKFSETLDKYKNRLVVGFTRVAKDPSNRGQGGGWRWHKWGEYYGNGTPTCEYLDDEDKFENGIYVFSIIELADEEPKDVQYAFFIPNEG